MRVLPNLLTCLRLLITPLVALSILGGAYGHALGWLVAAGVTHSLLAHPLVLGLPLMRVWVYSVAVLGLTAYVFRETVEPVLLQPNIKESSI